MADDPNKNEKPISALIKAFFNDPRFKGPVSALSELLTLVFRYANIAVTIVGSTLLNMLYFICRPIIQFGKKEGLPWNSEEIHGPRVDDRASAVVVDAIPVQEELATIEAKTPNSNEVVERAEIDNFLQDEAIISSLTLNTPS